jgi:hypothetical protein
VKEILPKIYRKERYVAHVPHAYSAIELSDQISRNCSKELMNVAVIVKFDI